jgi:DNA-binding beta-propeller fold protein YncE
MKLKLILTTVIALLLAVGLPATAATVQAAPFVYVTDVLDGEVSQYDAAGGPLSPLLPPTVSTIHHFPLGVAVSPDGRNVYVTTSEEFGTPAIDAAVLQYVVGTDGSLSLRSSAPIPADTDPTTLVVTPNGRSLYVLSTSGNGSIAQYSVGADGALTLKSPPTVATDPVPGRVAISPDGQNLYVTSEYASSVSQYSVAADGTLTPKSPPTVATGGITPIGIAISPDGKSVYVANANSGTVSQFDVDAAGTLSLKSPPTVVAGPIPFSVVVSPDSKSVYVTDVAAGSPAGAVSQFTVGFDGTLTPMSPASVPAGRDPLGIAVHPNGKSVYVANGNSDNVSQYSVGADGRLSAMSPAAVTSGRNPLEIAISPSAQVPTSKEQCKNGGWRNFPQFKNQGQCIAFVNHGP